MFLAVLITLLSYLSINYNIVEKPLFRITSKSTSRLGMLRKQRIALKQEQDSLSMVDDFVKYSKIQRRVNTLEAEMIELSKEKMGMNLQICLYFRVLVGVCLFIISMYYRNTPVVQFSRDWDFFPFSRVISYPCASYGCVSVPFWIVCSMSAMGLISH